MEFTITGTATVEVDVTLELSEEDLLDEYGNPLESDELKEKLYELAAEEFGGLTSYCGNNGTDKLIGTSLPNVSLSPGESIEWIHIQGENFDGE